MKPSKKSNSRRSFIKNLSITGFVFSFTPLLNASSSEGNSLNCNPTTNDYYGEGPFYTINPPTIVNNKLADASEAGVKIIIKGRVYNLDCSEYIPNTIIDIWHADDSGSYDNTGYNLRGKTLSDNNGYYIFETIKPGKYLNGSTFRPSHIHFKITPPGFQTLTTQLYFEGDSSIAGDAAASISSGDFNATSRIVPLVLNSDGNLEANWDIVINGEGIVGLQEFHLDKGMIYSAINRSNEVEIQFGVFNEALINVSIINIEGNKITTLKNEVLSPEKYSVLWNPTQYLTTGVYFVTLSVNDFQVHCIKLVI